MKHALASLMLVLAAATAFLPSPAYAQIELTEVNPPDGAQLDAPPEVVHLCFSEPVNIDDNTTFEFGYLMPDGLRLGLRIVFQPGGDCVDIIPGLPLERPAGQYTFTWQVTAAQGDEQGSGTLKFDVTEASIATPSPSPTPAPTPPPTTATPEAGVDREASPAVSTPDAADDATPRVPRAGDADDDDGGPDILLAALITTGAVGGAALLFTLGYLLRRRIGYEPHRPPEDDEGAGDH